MNQLVKLGITLVVGVLILGIAFNVLSMAMGLLKALFPLALLIGAGLIVYGLIRGGRNELGRGSRGYLDD